MRKHFLAAIILVILLAGCANNSAADKLNWKDNLEKALQQAKKENKAVLVNFTGSDWCVWCIRLTEEVFSKKEFETYAKKNLVLVKLDFPQKIKQSTEIKMYNNNLAQKYGIQGFPTILLFNSAGKLVLTTGYQPGGPKNYVEHLKGYL